MVDSIVGQANMIRSILGLPERELVEDTSQEEGKKPVVTTGTSVALGHLFHTTELNTLDNLSLPSDICEFMTSAVLVSTSLSTCLFIS